MRIIPFWIFGVIVGVSRAQELDPFCQDLDTSGCQTFYRANPNICADPAFSQRTCKRFCGNCPVECYSCSWPIVHPQDCNTTTVCDGNQTCVTKRFDSADGQREYILTCGAPELCLGLELGFGRREVDNTGLEDPKDRSDRDVHIECCHTNHCNYPVVVLSPPHSTPGAHTSVHSHPITHGPGLRSCPKDIVFLLDDSASVGHANFQHETAFVRHVISSIPIGPHQAHVSVVAYSSSTQIEWLLNKYSTRDQLIHALQQRLRYMGGGTDTAGAIQAVLQQVLVPAHGDRRHADNAVVIITDGMSNNPKQTAHEAQSLHSAAKDVVAIGVGSSVDQHELHLLGTDRHHVINVHSYQQLESVVPRFCST